MSKPSVWLHGEVRTPPFTKAARLKAGCLLRLLQEGEKLGLLRSRPLPAVGRRCHELRIRDENLNWRIVYRSDPDAIVVLAVFLKRTVRTLKQVIDTCRQRIKDYDFG